MLLPAVTGLWMLVLGDDDVFPVWQWLRCGAELQLSQGGTAKITEELIRKYLKEEAAKLQPKVTVFLSYDALIFSLLELLTALCGCVCVCVCVCV